MPQFVTVWCIKDEDYKERSPTLACKALYQPYGLFMNPVTNGLSGGGGIKAPQRGNEAMDDE